ncbi:MAG: SLC13 family permease, partial [Candidatus Limnocylindrales bacterium]
VEGIVHVGIVGGIAEAMVSASGGDVGVASIGLLWLSAIASAIVDNIPYTATAIPIVQQLAASGIPEDPLWWSLALGACLGGNATIIGASANVVVANLAGRADHPITFAQFLRYGVPVTAMSLGVSTAYLYVRYLM